jgi:hypothetical protein
MNQSRLLLLMALFLFTGAIKGITNEPEKTLPLNYVAYKTSGEIVIDGKLSEPCWINAPWTEDFADIEGYHMPAPLHRTRAKILWDDKYLYIGAELEEPHIWATYTEDEMVIFHENDFEVFIDPTGDTHNYYELEINALGTKWDLLMVKPYRNGGPAINSWEILGLKRGVHLAGTNNQPADRDTLWSIELALPWEVLRECAPGKRIPAPGDQWRINFSRVQWQLDIVDGQYVKRINPETGKHFPEFNWIWSPQGVIDMHRPESWGFVQFSGIESGKGTEKFVRNPDEDIKFALRELYNLQRTYFSKHQRYAFTLKELYGDEKILTVKDLQPEFEVTSARFMIRAKGHDGNSVWKITEDGRIWK